MERATAEFSALGETTVFLDYFKDLPDPRQRGKIIYPLAEVLLLTAQSVSSLLTKAGISVNSSYLSNVVSAVVAILNAQNMPASTPITQRFIPPSQQRRAAHRPAGRPVPERD